MHCEIDDGREVEDTSSLRRGGVRRLVWLSTGVALVVTHFHGRGGWLVEMEQGRTKAQLAGLGAG